MAATTDQRRAAERHGRRAEAIAALFLAAKLYRPVARRVRTPVGEIDLIVRRGRTIVFVEVKARASDDAATAAVTTAGRRRIAHAAAWWLVRHPAAANAELRFDVVVVGGLRRPRHIRAAFDATGAT